MAFDDGSYRTMTMYGDAVQNPAAEKILGMDNSCLAENMGHQNTNWVERGITSMPTRLEMPINRMPSGNVESVSRMPTINPTDLYATVEAYNMNQGHSTQYHSNASNSGNVKLLELGSVDTVLDTALPNESDFPISSYNTKGALPPSYSQETNACSEKTEFVESQLDASKPSIRLKLPLEVTPKSNAQPIQYNGEPFSLNGVEHLDQNQLRQVRSDEFTSRLDEFLRGSSELYRTMVGKHTRNTDLAKVAQEGGYDLPMRTPTAVWEEEQSNICRTAQSTRTPYCYGSDTTACDSELYFTPTLTNKVNSQYSYSARSNYCVYVGSDSNVRSCDCNMFRPCGGKCHASDCHLVNSELEPSTEHWPVSGSYNLRSLVKSLDRVIEVYKSMSPIKTLIQPEKMNAKRPPSADDVVTNPTKIAALSREPEYNNNRWPTPASLACRTSKEELAYADFCVPTSYEESPYDNLVLQREHDASSKTRKMPRNSLGEFTRDIDIVTLSLYKHYIPPQSSSPISTPDNVAQYNTPRPAKKSGAGGQYNGEKVSGVWYDTNRHLWRVVYMKGNKRKTQGFSSIKLGYEEARRKAIEMRHKMMLMHRSDNV